MHNIIGLDPDVEKKWLEQERNTVLDPDFKGDVEGGPIGGPGGGLGGDSTPPPMDFDMDTSDEASNRNNMERFGDTFVSSDVQDMFNKPKKVSDFFEHRAEAESLNNQLTLKKSSNYDTNDTQNEEEKKNSVNMNDKLSMADHRIILHKQDSSLTQKHFTEKLQEKPEI